MHPASTWNEEETGTHVAKRFAREEEDDSTPKEQHKGEDVHH
jgi:hypothetical protein